MKFNQKWEELFYKHKLAISKGHEEPYESRDSRTELREPQGEVPWGDSTVVTVSNKLNRLAWSDPSWEQIDQICPKPEHDKNKAIFFQTLILICMDILFVFAENASPGRMSCTDGESKFF